MKLPSRQRPKKITYEYSKKRYSIEGKELENYLDNIKSAEYYVLAHNIGFKKVDWSIEKIK